MSNAKDRLIIALDTSDEKEAIDHILKLKDYTGYFKVGLELFTGVGPKIIKVIKDEGSKVFFDGKFLDIPNTVSKAISNMVLHKVDMLNVYMSGGTQMISDARTVLIDTAKKNDIIPPKLLGVTVLTSITSDILQDDLKIKEQLNEYVAHLAELAIKNNMDGIICSPNEAPVVNKLKQEKHKSPEEFLIVTPGVRPSWAETNDQKRVATPKEAIQNGSTHIVIGRPVTGAKDPVDAIKKILEEIEGV